MKFLIVDDDEIARLSLSALLSPLASEVVLAHDGEDAWARLEAGLRPAVCCSDVVMPGLDGLGLLQKVRGHAGLKKLPFVLISSAADRQTVQNAVLAGVSGYILKPFLAVQTRCTVERVLHDRKTQRNEHVLVTRRRLDIGLGRLEHLLGVLKGEAQACAQLLATADPGAPAALQRLHGGLMLLGLWEGAALVTEVMDDQADAQGRHLAIVEVAFLVGDQLGELVQPVAMR